MLADLLAAHWPAYVAKFGRLIPPEPRAAVRAILRCRTPALGGQLYRCACGKEHYAYHSCNHRACPRCGRDDAAAWLAQQQTRLLPVPYFLATLTVPAELREPIRAAMKAWYGALLKEGAGALQDLAAQPKHLGAELGVTALLQTWTRDLRYHPHVHLLVPGGGLTADGLRWVRVHPVREPSRNSAAAVPSQRLPAIPHQAHRVSHGVKDREFFLPQVKLAARFKGRLKAWLRGEHPKLFQQVPAKVWWVKWVADVQPVGSGAAALKYLAAYLCRPPLHESQIEGWNAQRVTFRYRANGGAVKRSTVSGQEFVRRVLQHVLPKGFQRVRHYGWLGATLRDWRAPALVPPAPVPPPKCPGCGQVMLLIGSVARKPP
jgi:Putative transposase/Transposase zinc-binding domain